MNTPYSSAEHVDVLIIGAGLSGIGAAAHLVRRRPGDSYVVLEARSATGGTWDLFRYPGVRSDSDMYTLGYDFKPWTGERSLADGDSILTYVRETAREYGIEQHVRLGHRVVAASWNSDTARWTVEVDVTEASEGQGGDGGQEVVRRTRWTADFLWGCSGYYDYDAGHLPEIPGLDDFAGDVIHPQHWPTDFDYTDKQVVVIGSGATAITLVPALADSGAEHVTMLQRSPTYVLPLPGVDKVGQKLRKLLSPERSYRAIRWKNIRQNAALYNASRRWPGAVRKLLRAANTRSLPEGYPVDVHFNPAYDPWDQRLCVVPDGDLFRVLSSGRAEVVTDTIDHVDAAGIVLTSGGRIDADAIVTATGLSLLAFGGMTLTVDGQEVKLADTMAYRAMMLSGVPNFAFTIGYTNASWTLKADLVAAYVCRLRDHMEATGARTVVAAPDPSVGREPFMDFNAGYVLRALDRLPAQGDREPWKLRQSYVHDQRSLGAGDIDDGVLRFS